MVKDLPPASEPDPPADADTATPISNSSTSGGVGSTNPHVDVEKISSPSTSPLVDVKSEEDKTPLEEDRKDKKTILGSGSEKHEKKKHRRQSKEGKSSRSRRDHGGEDEYGGKKRRRTSGPSIPLARDMSLFSFNQRGVLSQGLTSSHGEAVTNTNSSSTNPGGILFALPPTLSFSN